MAWGWFRHPWALETASIIACFVQFVVMIIVCIFFNGKPIFDGPVITLNTIVSILSTGSKAAMLTVVASCISHSNWPLFSGPPRRLYDFERVADASRGPLGSFQLLLDSKFKGGTLTRMGAMITILAIAMDPFAQQLIQLGQAERSEEGGSFPRAVHYDQGVRFANFTLVNEPKILGSVAAPDLAMRAALLLGLTNTRAEILQQTSYTCPTSHCEYSNITSIAICSKCGNIDSSLQNITKPRGQAYVGWVGEMMPFAPGPGEWNATRFELPNGLFLQALDHSPHNALTTLAMLGTSNASKTITTKDINTLIWSQSLLKVNNITADPQILWPRVEVHAIECALYYCVKEYSVKVVNGTVTETSNIMKQYTRDKNSWKAQISSGYKYNESDPDQVPPLPETESFQNSLAYHPKFSYFDRTDLELSSDDPDGEKFSLSQKGVGGISFLAQNTFSSCRPDKPCSSVVEDRPPPTGFLDSTAHAPEVADQLWRSTDLETSFANIATSMSNALRVRVTQSTGTADDDSSVRGLAFRFVTLYRIRWEWVSLHVAIQVAAITFFLLTRWGGRPTGHTPIWKSSELAVMSRGLLVSDILKDARSLEQLNERAKEALVILVPNEEELPLLEIPTISEVSSIQARSAK